MTRASDQQSNDFGAFVSRINPGTRVATEARTLDWLPITGFLSAEPIFDTSSVQPMLAKAPKRLDSSYFELHLSMAMTQENPFLQGMLLLAGRHSPIK